MPGTSGRSLYERLEARVPAAAARVIFLTGDTADAETERFLRDAGRPVLDQAASPSSRSPSRCRRCCCPRRARPGS